MCNRLYYSPLDFADLPDRAAIQAAVDEAVRTDIRMVMIPVKPDGSAWELDAPVLLPDNISVVLDGAAIKSQGTAFVNARACDPETKSLGGEQQRLFLLGKNGAKLIGGNAPQVVFDNVKDYRIAGLSFEKGAGLRLTHCRHGKLQQLRFSGCDYGVYLAEGCNNNLIRDIQAETLHEAICWIAGDSRIWGRNGDMYDSILCRVRAKTAGAPAVLVDAGPVTAYNLFLRDITDETQAEGVSVQLGGTSDSELRDISVRNVISNRTTVKVGDFCDGIYLAGLQGNAAQIGMQATRVLQEEAAEAVCLPEFPGEDLTEYITPNDPAYYGESDSQTLQNAVDAAAAAGVKLVIPRYNARTGKTLWDITDAIRLPSDIRVELWGAHLRQADFTYHNLFVSTGTENITVTGLGDAVLDTGRPNGLKLKNAGTLGFGPITDNATMFFQNVKALTVENLHIRQSRWYSIYCVGCTHGRISDIELFAPPIFPDLGGIQLRSGCRDFLIENLTGLSGEDMILLGSLACDEVFAPENKKLSNIHIRNVIANASRCYLVNIWCHDGGCVENVLAETLLDNSLAEQKKQPSATVRIGHGEGYCVSRGTVSDIRNITLRDLNGRGASTLELGGCSSDVKVTNLHSFGTSENSVRTALPPECSDYLMASISADSSVLQSTGKETPMTQIRGWELNGVFFRCAQASRYMRGTATSIITDKKKFIGLTMQLDRLETEDLTVRNVLIDRAGQGVRLTGKAKARITGFCAGEFGRTPAVCGSNCSLQIDGETIPNTLTQTL